MKQAERSGGMMLWVVFAGLILAAAVVASAAAWAQTGAAGTKIKVIKIPHPGGLAAGGEVKAQTPAGPSQEAAPETTVKRIVIPRPGKAATKPPPSTPSEAKTKSEPAQRAKSSTSPRIKKIITHRKGKKPEERTLPDVSRLDPPKGGPKRKFDEAGGKLDMVLVRGQPPLQGRVIRLTGSMLLFSDQDQRTVPLQRRDLVLISFTIGQLGAVPQLPDQPEEAEPGDDLVITYDGKATSAKVSAITEDSVITNKTTFPRGRVNRILFAAEKPVGSARANEKEKDTNKRKNGGDDGTENAPGGDGAGEGPATDASRPAGTPVKACAKDQPLGGWLVAQYDIEALEDISSKARLRVHFPLVSRATAPGVAATWNMALLHGFEAPWMYYNLRMTDVGQTPGTIWDFCTISGGKVSGTAYFSVRGDPATFDRSGYVTFDPMGPRLDISFPSHEVWVSQPYACRKSYPRGARVSRGFHTVGYGGLTIWPTWREARAERTNLFDFDLTEPIGKCHGAGLPLALPLAQECSTHPDRYAVIPFVGDMFNQGPGAEAEEYRNLRIRFGICCGCGKVPDAQEFADEDETDCLDSARTQGKVFDAEFDSLYRALEQAYGELIAAMNLARAYQTGWRAAMAMCAFSDMADTILKGISASSGRFEWDPGDLFSVSPKYAPIPGKKRKVVLDWKVLEYIVDGYNLYMQGSTSALLRSKLARCRDSKAYAVSSLFDNRQDWEDVYDDALAFLDQRDRVARLAQEVGGLMSDLIQLDIERFSKMANLKARCIDCAKEQGLDPKRCDTLSRDLDYASQ